MTSRHDITSAVDSHNGLQAHLIRNESSSNLSSLHNVQGHTMTHKHTSILWGDAGRGHSQDSILPNCRRW